MIMLPCYTAVEYYNIIVIIMFSATACGVAHQALEGIDPKGQDILIQGTYCVCVIFRSVLCYVIVMYMQFCLTHYVDHIVF